MNLNKKITIQRRGSSQDTVGQPKEEWKNSASVFASIRPVSGREYFNASGERAEVTHQIVMRHGPLVTPRDRISFDGRIFDVKSVINLDERDRYDKLMATEHVGD